MALQQINWLQIDTAYVPSGSEVNLGAISGSLHSIYADHIYISGQLLSNSDELNYWSASIKEAIETTGSNLTVKGNLIVKGTTTAVESNVVTIGDNIVELNGTEAAFGGLLIKDPTSPNTISGSLLWDTLNDKWIGGPLGSEEGFIQDTEFTNFSSSVSTTIDEIGIWRETGSFYATSHDLQVTGSMRIKGDLLVEGQTTLVQKLDPNVESLVVSGAMNVVQNQINAQVIAASLKIQGLGEMADVSKFAVIDCGGFF
jgi:hypothetical protein